MPSPVAPSNSPPDGPIVLYDGDCGLCNRTVAFVQARQAGPQLRFVARSSPAGQELIRRFAPEAGAGDSVVLIEAGRCWLRSTAALRLCRRLAWPWRWLAWLLVVPGPVRDAAYRAIAAHRHRLVRGGSCSLPQTEERAR